ncbi:SDR family NAD(P)-dependent oxidoreductase [Amycolatopsis benzoatilytica]|uniref:SDR family NAD(P)-dependent oxidoreductase n=1 Tax=Amycolatopsis benzoatilytica TaxID=346045 RepID=UPI00035E3DDC|nr:SDR family NAD(P)-dependent oxidoreductase [Amycolatopsis benzoatilytica]
MTTTKLNGQVAVVTGAASGLGRAIAETFAEEGAEVALLDRDGAAAAEAAAKLRANGASALDIRVDVSSVAEVDAAIDQVLTSLGRIDVLCNSAGVLASGTLASTSVDDWDRCFAVNAKGTFLCCRAAIPHMVAIGGGAIVNLASVAALAGMPGFAAYSASKGAVVSLTRSIAVDFGAQGVRANVICPGTVPTAMTERMLLDRGCGDPQAGIQATMTKYPLRRLGIPSEIARAALFLAGDDSSFVTGTVVPVDGGLTA